MPDTPRCTVPGTDRLLAVTMSVVTFTLNLSATVRLPESAAEVAFNEPISVVCCDTHMWPVTLVFPYRSIASSALFVQDTLALLFKVSSFISGGDTTVADAVPLSVRSVPPTTVLVPEATSWVVVPVCVRFPVTKAFPRIVVSPTTSTPPDATVRPLPTRASFATTS